MGITGGVVEQEAAIDLSNLLLYGTLQKNQKIKFPIQKIAMEKK